MNAGHNQLQIAQVLGRHRSTISREIDRNSSLKGYRPKQAQALSSRRAEGFRNTPRVAEATLRVAAYFLCQDWSPEQVAWLGLTPRQTGTGGKIRQLGISKRGDAYVRTLLIHGTRAIIARSQRSTWVLGLLARRPYAVAEVALANKLARVTWAVLTKGEHFNSKLSMSAESVTV